MIGQAGVKRYVPPGGDTDEVLTKYSGQDYDVGWVAGGGGGVTMAQVIDTLYPVGSLYASKLSTNPGTLLGRGTWAPYAEGQVLAGYKDSDPIFGTPDASVGAETVAAEGTNSAPTFAGSALGTHSHGAGTLAPSAHSGTAVSAHAGAAVADHAAHTHTVTSNVTVADHASHTHSYTEVPNHVHSITSLRGASTGGATTVASGLTAGSDTSSTAVSHDTLNPTGGVASGTTAGPGAALTHSPTNNQVTSGNPSATLTHNVTQPSNHTVTQPDNHTMGGSSEAVSAGTPAGTVSAPTFTGTPTSVIQPSRVVYIWERTA